MKIALGESTYGIMAPSYPVRRMLKCFPKDIEYPCIAALFGCFGVSLRGLKAFCTAFSDRPHLIEMHISNECARRTGRDGKQILPYLNVSDYQKALSNPAKATKIAVRERVATVMDMFASVSNSKTVIVLSAGLESDLRGVALDNIHTIVKNVSRKKIVYSPDGGGDGLHLANYVETHSVYPNIDCAYWNNDGTSIAYHDGEDFKPTVQIATYINSFKKNWMTKKAVYLWDAKSQGLDGVDLNNPIGYTGRHFEITDNAIMYKQEMLSEMQRVVKGG